jgi:hypothetical protein
MWAQGRKDLPPSAFPRVRRGWRRLWPDVMLESVLEEGEQDQSRVLASIRKAIADVTAERFAKDEPLTLHLLETAR